MAEEIKETEDPLSGLPQSVEAPPVEALPEATPAQPAAVTPPTVPEAEPAPAGVTPPPEEEDYMPMVEETLGPVMDPEFLELLKKEASGGIDRKTIFGLAGLAATNPVMAQTILGQKEASVRAARTTLGTLTQQARMYQQAVMKDEASKRQAGEIAERWADRDWRTMARGMVDQAGDVGADIDPVPVSREGRAGWEEATGAAISAAKQEKKRTEAARSVVEKSRGAISDLMESADPATIEEGLKSILYMAGADPKDLEGESYDKYYKGYIEAVKSGAQRSKEKFQLSRRKVASQMANDIAALQQSEERLAIQWEELGVRGAEATAKTLELTDARLQRASTTMMVFRDSALYYRERDPELAQAYEEGILQLQGQINRTEVRYEEGLERYKANLAEIDPAIAIGQIVQSNLRVFGAMTPAAQANPAMWLAAHPNDTATLSFWDTVINDVWLRFPDYQSQEDVGAYVEELAISGRLGRSFMQPDPLTQYGAQPTGEQSGTEPAANTTP
jgi:hypothetical protein